MKTLIRRDPKTEFCGSLTPIIDIVSKFNALFPAS